MCELLTIREKRYEDILKRSEHATVVTVKANLPGADKRFLWSDYAAWALYEALVKRIRPGRRSAEHDAEGLVFLLEFAETAKDLKEICLSLESEHPLGRLTDLDVYEKGRPLSRSDFSGEQRTCFLCSQPAMMCARNKTHSEEALRGHIRDEVLSYLHAGPEYGTPHPVRCAELGLLSELCRAYGFGCVTARDPGAHTDMDFFTFLESLPVVASGAGGLTDAHVSDFSLLRAYGRRVEERMFEATKGVNTHKGAIFLYLTVAAALRRKKDEEALPSVLRRLAAPVEEDFSRGGDTHGLTLYRAHGIRGIRGEALRGFPSLFLSERIPETQEELLELTLCLLQNVEDTSAIHRAGTDGWRILKQKAKLVQEHRLHPEELDAWCKEQRISTGGTADLLGATVFLLAMQAGERMGRKK